MYQPTDLVAAGKAYDRLLPEDVWGPARPDVRETLSGEDSSQVADKFYEELDRRGRIDWLIGYIADDFEVRDVLLHLIFQHEQEHKLLSSALAKGIAEIESTL